MLSLLTNKYLGYAIAAGLLGIAIWWGCSHVYNGIYDSGYHAATLVKDAEISQLKEDYEKERAALAEADSNEQRRQTIANNAAKKRESEAIAQIEAQEVENLELRKELRREGTQDPDAAKPAISAGSVQRINKVR